MMPPVSIVIPCFNRERYIGEAIESALRQRRELQVEVVVVDDGSTDGSWSTIESFGSHIRSVRGANRGVSAARNTGIDLTSGRWIQFLDSDDRIPPGAVAEMWKSAARLGAKQIALGRMVLIDEQGAQLRTDGPATRIGPLAPEDFLGAFVGTPLPLYPKKALLAVEGFDERFRNHEDHELVTRLLAGGYSFVGVPTVICEARVHEGSRLSCDASDARFEHRLDVLQAITRTLVAADLPPAALSVHARLLWSVGREAARARQRTQAEALFQLARTLAGQSAIKGKLPVRLAQRLLSTYRAERLIEAAKSIARRLRLP